MMVALFEWGNRKPSSINAFYFLVIKLGQRKSGQTAKFDHNFDQYGKKNGRKQWNYRVKIALKSVKNVSKRAFTKQNKL